MYCTPTKRPIQEDYEEDVLPSGLDSKISPNVSIRHLSSSIIPLRSPSFASTTSVLGASLVGISLKEKKRTETLEKRKLEHELRMARIEIEKQKVENDALLTRMEKTTKTSEARIKVGHGCMHSYNIL